MAAPPDEDMSYLSNALGEENGHAFDDDPNAFGMSMTKKKANGDTPAPAATANGDIKKDPIAKEPLATPPAAKGSILGAFKKRLEVAAVPPPPPAATAAVAPPPPKPSPPVKSANASATSIKAVMRNKESNDGSDVVLNMSAVELKKKVGATAKKPAASRKKKHDADDDEGEGVDSGDEEAEQKEEAEHDNRILKEMRETNDVEGLDLITKVDKEEKKGNADFIPASMKRKAANGKQAEEEEEDEEEEEEEEEPAADEEEEEEADEEEDPKHASSNGNATAAAKGEGNSDEEDSDDSEIPADLPPRLTAPRAAKISAQQSINAVPDYIMQLHSGSERTLYGLELRGQDEKLREKLNADQLDTMNENVRRYSKMRTEFNKCVAMLAKNAIVGWCAHHPEWITNDPYNLMLDCYVEKNKAVPAGMERDLAPAFRKTMGLFGGAQLAERDYLTPDEFIPYLEASRLLTFMTERKLIESALYHHIWRGKLVIVRVPFIPFETGTISCEFSGIEMTDPAEAAMVFTRIDKRRDANGYKKYFCIGFAHKLVALWLSVCSTLCGFAYSLRRDLREYMRKIGCVFEKKKISDAVTERVLVKGAGGEELPYSLEVVDAYVTEYMKTQQPLFSQYWMVRVYLEQIKDTLLKDVKVLPDLLGKEPEFSPDVLEEYKEHQAALEAEREAKETRRDKDNKRRRDKAAKDRNNKDEDAIRKLDELIGKDQQKDAAPEEEAEVEAEGEAEDMQGQEPEEAAEEMEQ